MTATARPAAEMEARFARRMVPLAAAAAVLLAAAPPVIYGVMAWRQLRAQASIYAGHVAASLRPAAEREPYLWRYNAPKILQAVALHQAQGDIASVLVLDCAGALVFPYAGLTNAAGAAPVSPPDPAAPPSGRAAVTARGVTVAWVEVRMDTAEALASLVGVGSVSSVLGFVLGLAAFLLPRRIVRRQAREIEDTLLRLGEAEANLTEANQVLAARVLVGVREVQRLSERVVRIQEDERGRIARDLHDQVGQSLTALALELEIARNRPNEAEARIAAAAVTAEDALRDLRQAVHDLRPPELAAARLADTMRDYVERFEIRTGIAASFRAEGPEIQSEAVATCLLRVLQEALTNVTRHAAATEVGVRLVTDDRTAALEVTDDGRGFDPAAVHAGAGLRGVRERAAFHGGETEVEAAPGSGTRLLIRIPLGEGP